jgi:hypothetical protein
MGCLKMEADYSPEEKLFARLVEQYPPRPLPILKALIGFIVYTAALAMLCAGLWLVF